MRTSKKIVSLVLAVMMVASMMVVGAVSASAATVAKIGDTPYETLEAAFAAAGDGDTITVLADCTGNGIKVAESKFQPNGLTVDFGGYTYTVNGTTVGSTGTETQGFQLLRNNNITFKNGKITGSSRTTPSLKFLIQNYSNLTLDGMELSLIGRYYNQYTLSNNNGDIHIKDSTINAADYSWAGLTASDANSYAFDVCRYASYPSVSVTVEGNSVINGDVEVSASNNDAKDGFSLKLESGTMNGEVVIDDTAEAAMAATPAKATVTKEDTFAQSAAKIGANYYETLEAAFAAAQDGDTITLLCDSTGNGIKVAESKFQPDGLTVDFGGYTYTVNGTTVGSTGTETQGFQLLRNNNITFKNGAITGSSRTTPTLKFLIQNYSNLTLDNMDLSLEGQYYNQYTLSNNNGDIVIKDSTINAADYSWAGLTASDVNSYAFDVCRYASYPSVSVTVQNSTINGDVQVDAGNGDAKQGLSLALESGTMNGKIDLTDGAKDAIDNTPEKAEVAKATTFDQAAPEGYIWENGTTLVAVGAEIKGFQNKAVKADADESGVRILTKIDKDELADATEYGYVIAKVEGKDQSADFSKLVYGGAGRGEKVINCTGTYNNGVGTYMGDTVTSDNYVTLAVNGMSDGDQVAARFYVVKNGKTYYAKYVNTVTYDGIIATYAA